MRRFSCRTVAARCFRTCRRLPSALKLPTSPVAWRASRRKFLKAFILSDSFRTFRTPPPSLIHVPIPSCGFSGCASPGVILHQRASRSGPARQIFWHRHAKFCPRRYGLVRALWTRGAHPAGRTQTPRGGVSHPTSWLIARSRQSGYQTRSLLPGTLGRAQKAPT